MPIIITEYPKKARTENAFCVSRWQSSRLPYLFKIMRSDYNVTSVTTYASGTETMYRVSLVSNTETNSISVGDRIYWSAIGKVFTVVAKYGSATFDTDVNASDFPSIVGGVVNLVDGREGYEIPFKLKVVCAGATYVAEGSVTPNTKGVAVIDVSSFLNDCVTKENTFAYNVINKRDTECFGVFTIMINETWNASTAPLSSYQSTRWFFIDAVKQIGNKYGQNFADFVPFIPDEPTYPKAKFLTPFQRSTYFKGLPFTLSFIYPEELENVSITTNEEAFDVNGSSLGTMNRNIDINQFGGVNRLMMRAFDNLSQYDGTSSVDVWLKSGSVQQRTYTVGGYVADGYTEKIPPSPPVVGDVVQLTEKHRVMIVDVCDASRGFFFAWRNNLGGWCHWFFENIAEIEDGATVGAIISDEPSDIENAKGRDKILSIEPSKSLRVGGVVESVDFEGLKTIMSSSCVLLMVSQSPLKWLRMKPVPKTMRKSTQSNFVEYEFQFNYPSDYSIQN